MFKEVLVFYGIMQAAFSCAVFNSLQMSLNCLVYSFESPVTCPERTWKEFARTLMTIS